MPPPSLSDRTEGTPACLRAPNLSSRTPEPHPPSRAAARASGPSGYREPLNPNERSKSDDDPLNVRQRILDIYSKQGFDSIDPGDLRGRFRWMGLYTQRQQGIPGGQTATLEPEELEAPFFMMRIRIDGGALTSEQLRVVAGISTEFGRDVADVSDRQNVQLHWIRIEDVPEIWRRLESVGLAPPRPAATARASCSAARSRASPSIRCSTPAAALRETVDKYLGDPAFSNLPRKFKTSISGCARHCVNHEINDVAFVGVIGPDGTPGLRPLGRRRPVDQPTLRRAARRLRPPRRGQRGLGRRDLDLPRLRLPPLSATTPG